VIVAVVDAHAHVQGLVLVVKMVIVPDEYPSKEQLSFVRILWAKGISAKDNNKEILRVYGGKCLSRKAVHNWVEKFSQGLAKVAEMRN
jgi:hypothetical protein